MTTTEIQSAESVAVETFLRPCEKKITDVFAILPEALPQLAIETDGQYEQAAECLITVREHRKDLTDYFKEIPKDPNHPRPGEGLCFLTRKAWESANSLFNRFDSRMKQWDESLDAAMRKRRKYLDDLARMEAEAKAEEERKRLRAEAEKREAEALAERKRLEAEAERERKKAEAERQRRLEAEQAAATSKREAEDAKRRAADELQRIEERAAQQKREAEAEAQRLRDLAEAERRKAENVTAVVLDSSPKVEGLSVQTKWRARVVNMKALCAEIAAGKASPALVEANESNLNKLADANAGTSPPAGVDFYQEEVARRTRGKK